MESDSPDFSWMPGRSIVGVQLHAPCYWAFSFAPGMAIGTESPWRLLECGRLAIGSEDHDQRYGHATELDAAQIASSMLEGRAVVRVEVRPGTNDLLIDLAEGLRLEILPISCGYESWNVTTPAGEQVIAQGGGNICFVRDAH